MTDQPMTDAELRAVRERCERAFPPPWWWEGLLGPDLTNGRFMCNPGEETVIFGHGDYLLADEKEVTFVVNARTDVPRLLAEIERLKALLGEKP